MFGIDCAAVDENEVDWAKLRASGRTFAFVRATYGTSPDGAFDGFWPAVRDAGLVRGAYCYLRHDQSAEAQAEEAMSVITLESGDLPPVLDVEAVEGQKPGMVLEATRKWLAIIESWLHSTYSTSLVPMIYTSRRVWGLLGNPTGFAHYPLWVVDYQQYDAPRVPADWGDDQWTFHQYKGDTKGVPGVSRQADLDRFRALAAGAKGLRVEQLQALLVAAGHPIDQDGDFGPQTQAAVEAFQAQRSLVQDGIVGPKTFAQLLWP